MSATGQRAVVIGAGLSGLTAGVLLAEAGWQVTVLEQHAVPGGLMQRFKRGRRWFDTGLHFVTGSEPGGVFRGLAGLLGIADEIAFLPLETGRQFTVHAWGGSLDLPTGVGPAFAAMAERWPGQRAALEAFRDLMLRTLTTYGWLDRLAPPGTPPLEHLDHGRTVAGALAACGVGGDAAELVGSLTSILGMRPERCPFPLFCTFAGSGLAGAWRTRDGGDGIVRPLVRRLAALGGELRLRTPVVGLDTADRRVSAVRDGRGGAHPADAVIATCHPAEILRIANPGDFRGSFAERVASTPDSSSAVMVSVELLAPAPELGCRHHMARLPEGEDVYYVAPGNFEPEARPSLEVMAWVDAAATAAWTDSRRGDRPPGYAAWKAAWERRLIDLVCAHWPGLRPRIGRVWSSSPLTIRHYVRSRNGAAMGLSHDVGHLGDAPLMMRNHLRNLFLAGQSISHPGVLGTIIGGMALAGAMIGRDFKAELAKI